MSFDRRARSKCLRRSSSRWPSGGEATGLTDDLHEASKRLGFRDGGARRAAGDEPLASPRPSDERSIIALRGVDELPERRCLLAGRIHTACRYGDGSGASRSQEPGGQGQNPTVHTWHR